MDALVQIEAVRHRLASALQGLLWREHAGLVFREVGFDRIRAERFAADAIANEPPSDLPRPSFTTAARGEDAVRLWTQVAGCFRDVLGWEAGRACNAARWIVDPCFDLDEGCR